MQYLLRKLNDCRQIRDFQDAFQFSQEWLQKFKDHNGIHQRKLEGEASSANEVAIANALPLLRELCFSYSLERIYNMNKTGLFYR